MGDKYRVDFYRTQRGDIPAREFIDGLPNKLNAKIWQSIGLLKTEGLDLSAPLVKKITGKQYEGLYELRIKQGTDAARIFYFMAVKDSFVLLHGFLKKSNKTPSTELQRAKRYKSDYESRLRK